MKSNLAEDIVSITDLIHRAPRVIEKLKKNKRPILITQNGRAAMVCMDVEEYQRQIKTLEMIDGLLKGERAFAAGNFLEWDRFEKKIDRF